MSRPHPRPVMHPRTGEPPKSLRRIVLAAATLALLGCGGSSSDLDPDDVGTGGTLKITLTGKTIPDLPITLCAGFGQILTVQAQLEKIVVDFQIVELASLRGGDPIEEATVAGFRSAPAGSSLDFNEIWQTSSVTQVTRSGRQTTITGTMTGILWTETSPGVGGNPTAINGGAAAPFTITATCAQ